MTNLKESWKKVLDILEREVTAVSFDLFIKNLEPIEIRNECLYLCAQSETAKTRCLSLHSTSIKLALNQIFTEVKSFEILSPEEKDIHTANFMVEEEKNIASVSDLVRDGFSPKFNPKYTFETFVVGGSNRIVHAAARSVAENPSSKFNPLFIYGGVGLGKTHLMHAIGNFIYQTKPHLNVLYVTCEKFTNDYISSLSSKDKGISEFREKYRSVDVLLIDDIQFIIGKESTQNEFFNTFNTLYNEKKQIILSSDKPPKEIKTLDERIRSRFECGVPIDIHEPDYETRMAILKNKAEIDNLTGIPDEVFTYIAENITNNIRELEGALNKIGVFCKLVNEEVTLEVAKDSLKDIINKDHDVQITPDLIIKTVSEHLGINEDDIRSKKRSQDIATARQIVMYLCREYTVLALKSIGNTVGGKDHATVINGIKRVEEKINKDPAFKASIDTIIKKLNPNK